jgi:hypothetical protein
MSNPSNLPALAELTECPYCGHDEFSVRYQYSGKGIKHRRFDGEESIENASDNSGMFDQMKLMPGKLAYCTQCDKPIARYEGERE